MRAQLVQRSRYSIVSDTEFEVRPATETLTSTSPLMVNLRRSGRRNLEGVRRRSFLNG